MGLGAIRFLVIVEQGADTVESEVMKHCAQVLDVACPARTPTKKRGGHAQPQLVKDPRVEEHIFLAFREKDTILLEEQLSRVESHDVRVGKIVSDQ